MQIKINLTRQSPEIAGGVDTGGAGDQIKALASAAGAVNMVIFGIEEV